MNVERIIGHKEWAKGRKGDPKYSMDWRRNQVAHFSPPSANPTAQKEIDMFLVDDPGTDAGDSPKQWLCGVGTKAWIKSMEELTAYKAMGLYHWTEKPETRTIRAALLAARADVTV